MQAQQQYKNLNNQNQQTMKMQGKTKSVKTKMSMPKGMNEVKPNVRFHEHKEDTKGSSHFGVKPKTMGKAN